MKEKILKIFLVCIFTAAAAGAGGMLLVNKVFDSVLASQLESFDLKRQDGTSITALDMAEGDNIADNGLKASSPAKEARQEDGTEDFASVQKGPVKRPAGPISSGKSRDSSKNSAQASAEAGGITGTKPANSGIKAGKDVSDTAPDDAAGMAEAAGVSYGELAELEKKVAFSDKAKVTRIVAAKLTLEDVAALKSLARGGLTEGKLEAAKQLLKSRFSDEEKEELKSIFFKYLYLLKKR